MAPTSPLVSTKPSASCMGVPPSQNKYFTLSVYAIWNINSCRFQIEKEDANRVLTQFCAFKNNDKKPSSNAWFGHSLMKLLLAIYCYLHGKKM